MKKRRLLSIVLSLCMVLALMPQMAFAEEPGNYDELQGIMNDARFGGTVTLTKDYTINNTVTVRDTTLDLNGHVIKMTGNGAVIKIGEGYELYLADSNPMAVHDDKSLPAGGVITGGPRASGNGGGVDCTNADFEMTGGTIYNCHAFSAGGVLLYNSSFTMTGGTIYDCTASNFGDAVFSTYNSTIKANGGTIIGEVVSGGKIQSNDEADGCTEFYGSVDNSGTISYGIFYGGISGSGTVENTCHTVSFDLDGGSGTVPATQYFVNTNTAKALEPDTEPTREGYEFAGWYNGGTKYNFTQNVTEDITLTAKWESAKAPAFTGLENGKTYCDTVQFEVSDNVGVASVKAGDEELTPTNGKYTLEKGKGTVTVVAKDNADNETSVIVTVNDGHTADDDDGDCSTPVYCIYHPDTVVVAAKSHNFSGEWNKDEDGHWHICQNAGCTVPESKAHHSGTDDGDCTTAVVCECGYVITGAKSQHSYGEWQSKGSNTHIRYCTVTGCDGYEDGKCTGGTATCTAKAECEYCGAEYGELDSSNHSLDKIPAKDATVSEAGNIEYWECLNCSRLFADENGEKEISLEDTVIKKLTAETDGDKDQSTKADSEDSAKTGDDTNLALWLALMLLSGAGITGVTAYTRRKRINE